MGSTRAIDASGLNRTDAAPATKRVFELQGTGGPSPLVGQRVLTEGIVTTLGRDGFYIQDPQGDGKAMTSDAVFVYVGPIALTVEVAPFADPKPRSSHLEDHAGARERGAALRSSSTKLAPVAE